MTWWLLDLGETLKVVEDVDNWRIAIVLLLLSLLLLFPYKESLLCAWHCATHMALFKVDFAFFKSRLQRGA